MKDRNTITMEQVNSFIAKTWLRILLRGVLSLCVVAVLIVLYMAFAPRTEGYKLELQVSLSEKNGVLVYENDKPFSTSDIVAAPLLRDLWNDYGFAKRGVKFDDFSSCFSIYNWNKERSAIDAELASKLAKRNVTVADIAAAQETYDKKIATLDKHSFAITYTAKGICSDRDATSRMLADLPMRWAMRARRVYAPTMPTLADAESVKAGLARFNNLPIAEFDTIDYLRQYCEQLCSTCSFARTLMKGNNLSIDGITVGKLTARIDLAKREIDCLFTTLLALQRKGKDALALTKGRRETLARDMMTVERQIVAVQTAIAALSPSPSVGDKGRDSGLTLQADGNFLGQYADLIKRNVHAEELSKYIADRVRLEAELAALQNRDLSYAQIEQAITNTTTITTTTTIDEMRNTTVNSVLALGSDVERFREYVIDNSLLPGDFYKVQSPVFYAKSYRLSLLRFILGILALWSLYNLIGLLRAWNDAQKEC